MSFNSDFDMGTVDANNIPKNVCFEACHLAALQRWYLLDAVLTTLDNILVELVDVLWQTQA